MKIRRFHITVIIASAFAVALVFNNCAPNEFDSNSFPTDAETSEALNEPIDLVDPIVIDPGNSEDPGLVANGDPGSGLWIPPGMPNRTVADPSGPAINRIVSYVPGCLNGSTANNSATGCAANSSYTSTLAGTTIPHTVSLYTGKQLVLRYRANAGAGTSVKGIYVSSATGGAVGANVKVWLSTDPTATYESVDPACRDMSTSFPSVSTGPGYCPISASSPNLVYYFGFESSSSSPLRFKVQESQSDFY